MKHLLIISLCLALFPSLAPAAAAQSNAGPLKPRVAILIFDGVQIIDYTGPYEVFGATGLEVFTVAQSAAAITTNMGMSVNPKYTFDNNPKPDVIVIPGGSVNDARKSVKTIKWIQDNAKDAKYVLTVCNGAFILAATGLLDGLEATTTANLIDALAETAPKTKMVSDQRFVDNGKIVTSGGLSAGIEGALHVVSKLYSEGTAQAVALALEYHWDRNSSFLPGTLARKQLVSLRYFFYQKKAVVASSIGNTDSWKEVDSLYTDSSAQELMTQINNHLVTDAQWAPQDGPASGQLTSHWKFSDRSGQTWGGSVTVAPDAADAHKMIVTVAIMRLA